MGVTDDGRLELDDLGSVLDHASSLEPSAPDDLLEGSDAPTWSERLEARGITPWFRRHRVGLAGGAIAVVAVGALGSAWTRAQPPQVDPTIRATVADALSNGLATEIPGVTYDGSTAVAVHVEPAAGEAITVLGINGPGIRTSRAVRDSTASRDAVDDVFLVPGCDDPRSTTATFDDYRLQVRRTDAYGRVTPGSLTLPSSIAAQLADGSTQNCFQSRLSEAVTVTEVGLITDLARRTVTATITIHSALDQDLLVQGVSSVSTALDSAAEPADLTAGADTTEQVRLTLQDCTPPAPGTTRPGIPGGTDARSPDLSFYVTPLSGGTAGAGVGVFWSPADRARIASATSTMCAGGPGATARVLSASPAPVAVSRAYGFTGPNDGVVLRMRVQLASPGSRVALTDGTFSYGAEVDGPRSITTASADTGLGPRVVTVDWAAQCSSTMGPPDVWLTARAGGRSFPYRGKLDQAVLAHAYSAACPGAVPADLSGFGWPTG